MDVTLAMIDGQPLTVGALRSAAQELETLAFDFRTAVDNRFRNMDADFKVAEDVAGVVAQLPVIGQYGTEAKLALEITQFALDHPADAEDPAMKKAAGPDNVTL